MPSYLIEDEVRQQPSTQSSARVGILIHQVQDLEEAYKVGGGER